NSRASPRSLASAWAIKLSNRSETNSKCGSQSTSVRNAIARADNPNSSYEPSGVRVPIAFRERFFLLPPLTGRPAIVQGPPKIQDTSWRCSLGRQSECQQRATPLARNSSPSGDRHTSESPPIEPAAEKSSTHPRIPPPPAPTDATPSPPPQCDPSPCAAHARSDESSSAPPRTPPPPPM